MFDDKINNGFSSMTYYIKLYYIRDEYDNVMFEIRMGCIRREGKGEGIPSYTAK